MKIPYKNVTIGTEVVRVPDLNKIFGKSSGLVLLVIIVALWLVSGFYVVGPDEAGVIRTFGKLSRVHQSGLNFHFPYPIEQVDKPKVTEIKRIEVGFHTDPRSGSIYDEPDESLMLTGSLNIIDIDLVVQYKIKDPVMYLFRVRDVRETISLATEAVIRQVVGYHSIDEALTTGKGVIQTESLKMLQDILDGYETGVTVIQVQMKDVLPPEQVADAFREVASAKEDKSRLINEAQGYANNIIPKARGEAAEKILQAEAFSEERVKRAEGEAEKFISMLTAYKRSPKVTRKRMLLETMEEVLPGLTKYIIQTPSGGDLVNVVGTGLPGSQKNRANVGNNSNGEGR